MKKLVYDKDGKIGTITKEKINLIINAYSVMGLIHNKINAEDIIYTQNLENNMILNEDEKNYLDNKKQITMCVDPDWMPLEGIENAKHIGIAADYIKIIENKIKTPITLVPTKTWSDSLEKGKKRVCDIFSLMMTTLEREQYLNFSKPYLEIPLVVAADINAPFIENIQQIKNQKLAIVKDYAYAGLDAHRMGLGPVYATKKLFDKTGITLKDIDLIEMNEAFAAQVIANIKAFASEEFCQKAFNCPALGQIDESILNVNGGAIALGHPVGMSGARIILTALKELKRRDKNKALATLCIGGGQGAAFLLEI